LNALSGRPTGDVNSEGRGQAMTMIGSSSMQNARRRQWCMLALIGLLLLIAYVIGGGRVPARGVPTAMAANNEVKSAISDCMHQHRQPSFGGTVVVDTNEVECGNLTTFGGTVAINGEVKGDVVAFNSDVVIAGTVDGNIELYGGNVILH